MQGQGDDQQEGAGAGQQHPAARCHTLRLDQLLGGTGCHHARQGPSGERRHVLVGTRGQDQVVGFENPESVRTADAQSAFGVDAHHVVLRKVGDSSGMFGQVVPEFGAAVGFLWLGRGNGREAVDLSTRPGSLVDDRDRQATLGQRDGRRHAGGAGSDDHNLRAVSDGRIGHVGAHGSSSLAGSPVPCWRVITMPSVTGTRQPWRLGRPSIVTRQSKQTPIPQKNPLGALSWAVVRSTASPADHNAAATLWPGLARNWRPSNSKLGRFRIEVRWLT